MTNSILRRYKKQDLKINRKIIWNLPFITKDLASNDNLEISLAVLEDEDFEPEPEVEDELRPSLLGSRVPLSL